MVDASSELPGTGSIVITMMPSGRVVCARVRKVLAGGQLSLVYAGLPPFVSRPLSCEDIRTIEAFTRDGQAEPAF